MDDTEKIQFGEDTIRILEGFRLLDDDFMTAVFEENIEATQLLLNIILERDDMDIISVETQKEENNPIVGGRSITLDIFAKDSDGKVYDIEIQRQDEGADVHRARFHSSIIDSRILKEKQKFKEIRDSYVIFVTENDVMKMGFPIYHVERVVQESSALFGDGSHIIYVNGAYKNDESPIGKLMHDFRCTSASDMFYPELAKSVRYFKETEGGRAKMCKAIEDMRDKDRQETRIETIFNNIKGLMESMKWTADQAMNAMQISDSDRAILVKRF